MSDGSSGGLSGTFELIGKAAQQPLKAAAAVGSSAVKQVAGSGGVAGGLSGSFDMQGGLKGGDLFSPDAKGGQKPAAAQNTPNPQQVVQNTPPIDSDEAKIASIQNELKAMMHKQNYYDPTMQKIEEIRRKREQDYQEAQQQKEVKKMEDLQQQQVRQQDQATYNAAHHAEIKGNSTG